MSVSNKPNPHALDQAQSPSELFEVMKSPTKSFDPYKDDPVSTCTFATRADVHKKYLWHCSVHIWIVKSPSQILLQKRSMNKDTFPGRWDISSAGHIEAGKSPLEAAYSEIAEELGIDLQSIEESNNTLFNGGLQFGFIIPAEQALMGGCNAFEHVYFLVLNENSDLKLSLGSEEVTDVVWMDCKKLLQLLRSRDDKFAPRTLDYVNAMEEYTNRIFADQINDNA